jgi:long-subunit acyl-CoA synthetase (AMP-forming)/pyrroloquinoline quinone (PQQ) biosynthesis protein C
MILSQVIAAMQRHAAVAPHRPALIDGTTTLTYAQAIAAVERTAAAFRQAGVQRLALALDNGVAWVVADLAAILAGVVVVPLPPFFTAAQRSHALADAGVDFVLHRERDAGGEPLIVAGAQCLLRRVAPVGSATLPPGTAKVTYTSGTTGAPKGVCLSLAHLETVAAALAAAVAFTTEDRHLCVLPLGTLLENVAGIYAPLLAGAASVVPPLATLGLSGSSGLDAAAFAGAVTSWQPTTTILIPQMLQALTATVEEGGARPRTLRFVAVGGARVAPQLLARAAAVGVPVYQGYGLSECASVVALNTAHDDVPGSVGRVLPHVDVTIEDGEIVVRGGVMLGYAGESQPIAPVWHTGDVGHFDAARHLHVTGRRRNALINAFGRNVSPEWVESELLASPAVMQALVFGEARPWLGALLVAAPGASPDALATAVAAANARLPDYGQIRHWLPADAPFTSAGGDLTANGRPRRERILARYAGRIESLYLETRMTFHSTLLEATREERAALMSIPFIRDGGAGRLTRDDYLAFLGEAYQHVKHTLPLLMACGARLPARLEWLRREMTEYVKEETGHQDWILNDITACGGDAARVRDAAPAWPAELMVSYAYDVIARGNPVGFLGMVLVLEGTSTAVASQAAGALGAALRLPPQAFTYLTSHGALDVGHMDFYATLVNRLDDADDQAAIVHAAKRFYRLYGDVFRELDARRRPALQEAA